MALGGALGALLRWGLGEAVPDGAGFPWTTFAINVAGSFVLALLPALRGVRRSRAAGAGLGPGVLGGFTTLSAYAEQTRALLADGRAGARRRRTSSARWRPAWPRSRWPTGSPARSPSGEFEDEEGDE